ncbi:hypothetical protein QQ045_029557 [Rhodiola kirilowii]
MSEGEKGGSAVQDRGGLVHELGKSKLNEDANTGCVQSQKVYCQGEGESTDDSSYEEGVLLEKFEKSNKTKRKVKRRVTKEKEKKIRARETKAEGRCFRVQWLL